MRRLVKVSLCQLTDQELDDLAAAADATDPARAAALRHLKKWRRDHALPAVHERDRVYMVLR